MTDNDTIQDYSRNEESAQFLRSPDKDRSYLATVVILRPGVNARGNSRT